MKGLVDIQTDEALAEAIADLDSLSAAHSRLEQDFEALLAERDALKSEIASLKATT